MVLHASKSASSRSSIVHTKFNKPKLWANKGERKLIGHRADACLKKYGRGPVLRKLRTIGTHWVNRRGAPISGRRSQAIMRRATEQEGFSRLRLGYPTVLRVLPEDRQHLFDHNEKMKVKDSLLPRTCEEMDCGTITKSHCMKGLLMYGDGNCKWHDTKSNTKS